jgi:hypothetical protein
VSKPFRCKLEYDDRYASAYECYAPDDGSFTMSEADAEAGLTDQFRRLALKHGMSELKAEQYAKQQIEDYRTLRSLAESDETYAILTEFMKLHFGYWQAKDTRRQSQLCYPLGTVLAVDLLATLCGSFTCGEVADFLFWRYGMLMALIGGLPPPDSVICAETVRCARILVTKEDREKYFRRFFAQVKEHERQAVKEKWRLTVGFDGQEVRASFRRGERSRRKKGAQGEVVYVCDTGTALGYTDNQLKNQEAGGLMRVLKASLAGEDQVVVVADALNTRLDLIGYLDRNGLDYLLPVKNNNGNDVIVQSCAVMFSCPEDQGYEYVWHPRKAHGRIETKRYTMLPLAKGQVKYGSAKSVLRVIATRQQVLTKDGVITGAGEETETVTYYLTSLPYSEASFRQCVHSHQVRWKYESHHYTLDTVLKQDSHACCDDRHLSAVIGNNKIAFNLLNADRDMIAAEMTAAKPDRKSRPKVSFKKVVGRCHEDQLFLAEMLVNAVKKPILEKQGRFAPEFPSKAFNQQPCLRRRKSAASGFSRRANGQSKAADFGNAVIQRTCSVRVGKIPCKLSKNTACVKLAGKG